MKSLAFFLALVLLFQAVTFSPQAIAQSSEEIKIPSWFKNNAKWWEENRISDKEILNAIQNLLDQGVIKLDSSKISETSSYDLPYRDDSKIPSYVKQIFVYWQEGTVSDSDVSNALKFLIESGIIKTPSTSDEPRPLAAIIDQLNETIPNKDFNEKAQQYLELAGYKVDFYTTKDITIDFYKNLPSKNYKYIIIRTHSLEEPTYNNATFLFTGEKYDVNKYFMEQISGQLGKGAPIYGEERAIIVQSGQNLDERMYFLVGTKFVDELMVGKFSDSTIVIGGCESLRNNDLAKSFISRGAMHVVGWDRTIGATENDKILLEFLERTIVDEKKIDDVVIELNDEYSEDLMFFSKLRHAFRAS
jgi:DNA-binding Lrp family transcriptional regulator